MTLRVPAKVLLHVWIYDFYDRITVTSYDKGKYLNFLSFLYRGFDFNVKSCLRICKHDLNTSFRSALCKRQKATSLKEVIS